MPDDLLVGIVRRDLASSRDRLAQEAKELADSYARVAAMLEDEGRAVSSVGGYSSPAAARAQQLAQEINRLIGMTEVADLTLPKEGA